MSNHIRMFLHIIGVKICSRSLKSESTCHITKALILYYLPKEGVELPPLCLILRPVGLSSYPLSVCVHVCVRLNWFVWVTNAGILKSRAQAHNSLHILTHTDALFWGGTLTCVHVEYKYVWYHWMVCGSDSKRGEDLQVLGLDTRP